MANDIEMKVNLVPVMETKDISSNMQQLQKYLNQLKLPDSIKGDFSKIFKEGEKYSKKISDQETKGFHDNRDVNNYESSIKGLIKTYQELGKAMGSLDTATLQKAFSVPVDTEAFKKLATSIAEANKSLSDLKSKNMQEVTSALGIAREGAESTAKSWQAFATAMKNNDFKSAGKALAALKTGLDKVESGSNQGTEKAKAYRQAYDKLEQVYNDATKAGGKYAEQLKTITDLEAQQQGLTADSVKTQTNQFENYAQAIAESAAASTGLAEEQRGVAESEKDINKELTTFKSKAESFFGISNSVHLFQTALREAYNTIKELDAVMTETAVVTEFDVGDMWDQLPEYTKRANELGVSIKSAYESATLFYQQGLDTAEVTALSTETLKMARIANLDAATATDRMTNALRGFNMEITEANAQNVNDVYTKLAAISAADVDEISTAMTKVASLANSANMEFESTAAFLTQIIETTRESAETAGTALKTVIARFSEVKSLYSEGELTGTDSEGEAIDVNKVATALRTAGINLNEYLTGMKGLDEIFLELSEKWDTLDTVQQRYIATMAAGSRQQSRFIAMMADYSRTTELVTAANNAAGASNEQFEKTTDSLQSKLNKLKNAWDEFLLTIADNELIKSGVDLLTKLITTINNLTSSLGDFSGVAKVALGAGMLKVGKSISDNLFKGIGAKLGEGAGLKKAAEEGGKKAGSAFSIGLVDQIDTSQNTKLKDVVKNFFTTTASDVKTVQKSVVKDFTEGQMIDMDITFEREGYDALQKLKEEYTQINTVIEEHTEVVQTTKFNWQALGGAMTAVGTIFAALGEATDIDWLKDVGTVLAAVGGVIMGVIPVINALGVATTKAGVKISIAGWSSQAAWWPLIIAFAALAAIIALVVVAVKEYNANSPEGQLEAATEAAEEAADAAERAATAFSELSDAWESLQEKQNNLDELTEGTAEWREAVQENNAAVLELMESYEGLEVEMKNGVLSVTEESMEAALDAAEKASILASSASIGANQKVIQKQTAVAASEVDIGTNRQEEAIARAMYGDFSQLTEAQKQLITQLDANETVEQVLADSMGIDSDFTEEEISALQEYSDQLKQADAQTKANNEALASNTAQLVALNGGSSSIASGFLNNGRIEEFNKQAESVTAGGYTSQEFKDYIKTEFGSTAEVGKNGKVTYETDEGEQSTSYDYLLSGWQASLTTTFGAEAAESLEKGLNEQSGKIGKALTNVFEDAGDNISNDDLIDLLGLNLDQLKDNTGLNDELRALWDQLDNDVRAAYQNKFDKFSEDMETRITGFVDELLAAEQQLTDVGVDAEFSSKLAKAQKQSLSDNYFKVFMASGAEAAEQLSQEIASMMDSMDTETAQKFADALNSVNWDSATSVEGLSDVIEELELNTNLTETQIENLEDQLINLAKASKTVDLTDLIDQIQTAASLLHGLRADTQTLSFSSSDKQVLTTLGAANSSDFQYNVSTKSYDYMNGQAALIAGIQDTLSTTLDQRIQAGQVAKNLLNDKFADLDTTSAKDIQTFLINYATGAGDNSSIDVQAIQALNYDTPSGEKALMAAYEEVVELVNDLDQNQEYYAQLSSYIYQSLPGQDLVSQLTQAIADNDESAVSASGLALAAKATAAGVADEYVQKMYEAINNSDYTAISALADLLNQAITYSGYDTTNTNEFTQLYNLAQEEEQLLYERNQQEREYNQLLETSTSTQAKIVEAYQSTVESIGKQQVNLEKQLVATQEELKLLDEQNYTDDNGNTKQYSEWIKDIVDENGQVIVEAYASITDEETREAVKSYLSARSTYISEIRTLSDEITSNQDELKTLQETAMENYLTWEQRVYDAYVDAQEKQIEALEDLDDTLSDSMSDIIDSIQDQIDAQRQARENEDAEQEIADMETRLAYLKRDTSGANALEIKELEEKLADARQDYSDSLVDQAISQMQDDADMAAEQRAEQIQLLRDQLDAEEKSGAIWAAVGALMTGAVTSEGTLNADSALVKLLQSADNYSSKSETEQQQWLTELQKTWASALAYNSGIQISDSLSEEDKTKIKETAQNTSDNSNSVNGGNLADVQEQIEETVIESKPETKTESKTTSSKTQTEAIKSTNFLNGNMMDRMQLLQQYIDDHTMAEGDRARWGQVFSQVKDSDGNSLLDAYNLLTPVLQAQLVGYDNEDRITIVDDSSDSAKLTYLKNHASEWADLSYDEFLNKLSKIYFADGLSAKLLWSWNLSKAQKEKIYPQFKQIGTSSMDMQQRISTAQKEDGFISTELGVFKLEGGSWQGNYYKWPSGSPYYEKRYLTGGLADFTGPAWLDGSKSAPELVLSASDTQNFLALKDALASFSSGNSTVNNAGDAYYDININAEIGSDYDVDQLAEKVKKQITDSASYRNVNTMKFLR